MTLFPRHSRIQRAALGPAQRLALGLIVALGAGLGARSSAETAADTPAPLASIQQLQALPPWQPAHRHPLALAGTVTWLDAIHGTVVLEDETGAVALKADTLPSWLSRGQQVTCTAPDSIPYLAALPEFPRHPTTRSFLAAFETPFNWAEHYVARVHGFVIPPRTGNYRFWIASDDSSELWLSTDEQPAHIRYIARAEVWTKPRDWDRSPLQRSDPIPLVAGRRYYITALHEQRDGDANLSVAWEGPSLPRQVIDGDYLSAADAPDGDSSAAVASPPGSNATGRITWEVWKGAAVDGTWRLLTPRKYESLLAVTAPVFTAHGSGALPTPRRLTPEQSLPPESAYRWSEVEGRVEFAGREGDSLVLELTDAGRRLRAIVQPWDGPDPLLMKRRRVRLQGVAAPGLSPATGEPVLARLWVPGAAHLTVLDPATAPEYFRAATLSELLLRPEQWPPNQPARITGEIVAGAGTRELTVRDSGTFAAYVSQDGVTWQPLVTEAEIPMPRSVFVGLAVNSNSADALASARFEQLDGLAPPLREQSIGLPPGSGSVETGTRGLLLRGRGREIWTPPDQFHFAFQPVTGDGEFVVRLTELNAAEREAKAGLMIRDALAPDAQFVDLIYSPATGIAFQWRRRAEGVVPRTIEAAAIQPPCWLKLTRRTSTLTVHTAEIAPVTNGQTVAAIGYLSTRDGPPQLVNASCRSLSASTDTKDTPRWSRPLVDIDTINRSPSAAGDLDIFRVRGVVTFAGEVAGHRYLAVQDHSGGTLVRPRATSLNPLPAVGQWIEIQSNPGWHPPVPDFVADSILQLGAGLDPHPLRHPLEYLLPKQGDGTWIEIEGIVRSVSAAGLLQLKENGELFSVHINHAPLATLAGWIDARVRIRGVITFPSEQKRLLLVPGPDRVELIAPAPGNPFDQPLQSIASLAPARLINQSRHRVRLAGVVTASGRGFFYLQDGDAAARVEPSTDLPVRPGSVVEVVGFPDPAEDKSLLVSDALVVSRGTRPAPEPLAVDSAAFLDGRFCTRLVRVTAIVLGLERAANGDYALNLQAHGRPFRAWLAGSRPNWPALPAGSIVALTGVAIAQGPAPAWIQAGGNVDAAPPVRLLLRSTADVAVLQTPRWWVMKRTLLFAGVAVSALLIASGWIYVLRRRVAQRTAELSAAMSRLKQETQRTATLAERDRLAGEIHDSLEQGFNGLMLQLDTTAKRADCPPGVRSGLDLARRMVSFSRAEVRHAVWDLQSPLLDQSDLGTALAKMVSQLNPGRPQVSLEITGTARVLPPASEHHLLRIAQEAITNAIKHAHASSVVVTLAYAEDATTLTIRDDGRGFVAAQALAGGIGHFGLRSLRGRARKIDAELNLASEPGRGTTITLRLPRAHT